MSAFVMGQIVPGSAVVAIEHLTYTRVQLGNTNMKPIIDMKRGHTYQQAWKSEAKSNYV